MGTILYSWERDLLAEGFQYIAGIDEVGRGPLAGPVVAAAVILPSSAMQSLSEVRDSKQLAPKKRERLFPLIQDIALNYGFGSANVQEIDSINILQATLLAMERAVSNLALSPDYLLIDGPYSLSLNIPQRGITKGDQHSITIASASILAKVWRDRYMEEQHKIYPHYGFNLHKGYGTPYHLKALEKFGPCPLHRMSFRLNGKR